MQPYVIGIDIGTGSVKAIAADHKGAVIAAERLAYGTASGEEHEQDADAAFAVFQQCLRQIVAVMGAPPAAVSLSCTMHSLLAVDKQGAALTKAMLWSDNRGSEAASALRSMPEGPDIYAATGTPLHAMSPLCKLKWMRNERPQIFQQAHKFISIKEFIWHRLFGNYEVDHSIASATGLFNIHQLQWDKTALALVPVSAEKLSVPVPEHHLRTGMPAEVAASLGLQANTPFCIGASDGCLANLGSLCFDPSAAAITIGTSAAVRITSKRPAVDRERMFFNYVLEENFICGGAINNGGNSIRWMLKNFLGRTDSQAGYEQLYNEISQVAPGAEGLIFLPYINGERAPIWDEKACGVFFGLRSNHLQPHFARAAVEGVCLALSSILFDLEKFAGPVDKVRLSGGVMRSAAAVQILADVTGKTVLLQQEEDASAVGAAYLLLRALGLIQDYSNLGTSEPAGIRPRPEAVSKYRQVFAVYQELYPSLKGSMHKLHQMNS